MQKNINIGGIWTIVELTEEEREKVLSKLLESNINELLRCITAVCNKDDFLDVDTEKQNLAIKILFEKQATASFTAFQEALDKKISSVRKSSYKKPDIPEEKEVQIKKVVEEELKKAPEERRKSIFDDAFHDGR